MLMNTSSDFLVPSIDEKLCAYQKDRISQMIRDYLEINQQMDHFHFEYCPKCGQHHPMLVKAGKTKASKQMLKCNSCKKRFVCDHGQLTYYSHQPQSKWNDLIIETQNGNSLLFVCVTNIFISLKIWSVPYVLHHEIEMDETYVTHCRKGRFIEVHPGKKRGTCASRAGLSDEKVCIFTAVQHLGKCIARSLNVSKPSTKNVEDFCQSVADRSYVWTDGLQSYTKVLCEKKCTNKVLNTYSEYDAVNHLNNVNSFHSMIKEQYRFYRGVSIKYINRYNALFTLQKEYQGMDSQEFLLLIMKRLRGQVSYFFIRQIRKEDLFKFAIT